MKIAAVDPGLMTGYAWWNSLWPKSDPLLIQTTWTDTVDQIEREIDVIDAIVVESFIPRPGVRSWQPEPLYAIGALQYLALKHHKPFALQSPADAKNFSTNDKLRKLGWYRPSMDHAMDATRHLLLYAVRNGAIDPVVFT